jgi:hypothetical protein
MLHIEIEKFMCPWCAAQEPALAAVESRHSGTGTPSFLFFYLSDRCAEHPDRRTAQGKRYANARHADIPKKDVFGVCI